MQAKIETITKDIAKEYLKNNGKNRAIKWRTVESYARDMRNGKFLVTHQGIAFDEGGELIDGQHRLLAVVMADVPVDMLVMRDVPKQSVSVLDRGVTRTVRDIISIERSYSDSPEEFATLASAKVISGLNQLIACCVGPQKLTTDDIKRLYREFKTPTDKVYDDVISKVGNTARAPMISAAIAAVSCGVEANAVAGFFRIFFKDDISGCERYNIQAALNWKRQFDNSRANRVTMDRKNLYLGTQNAIYHFVNNTELSVS